MLLGCDPGLALVALSPVLIMVVLFRVIPRLIVTGFVIIISANYVGDIAHPLVAQLVARPCTKCARLFLLTIPVCLFFEGPSDAQASLAP